MITHKFGFRVYERRRLAAWLGFFLEYLGKRRTRRTRRTRKLQTHGDQSPQRKIRINPGMAPGLHLPPGVRMVSLAMGENRMGEHALG